MNPNNYNSAHSTHLTQRLYFLCKSHSSQEFQRKSRKQNYINYNFTINNHQNYYLNNYNSALQQHPTLPPDSLYNSNNSKPKYYTFHIKNCKYYNSPKQNHQISLIITPNKKTYRTTTNWRQNRPSPNPAISQTAQTISRRATTSQTLKTAILAKLRRKIIIFTLNYKT